MRYLSVCSGVEAASVAWEPLGFVPVAFAEIENFPSAVLAHRFPDAPNLGDMTAIDGERYRGKVDVLVGGTPCQSFSVAGLRKGLDDDRGNLTLHFVRLADAIGPAFVVWENVPGVLSDPTNAFGAFLAGLAGELAPFDRPEGGWTDAGLVDGPDRRVAWRALDAQYFGLAQRRKRVFVVACPRDGADPAAVLFECEGVQRHSPPCRETGQGTTYDVAPCLGASGRGVERPGETRGQDPVVAVSHDPACTLTARERKGALPEADLSTVVAHALRGEGFDASEDGTGRGTQLVPVAFDARQSDVLIYGDHTGPIDTHGYSTAIAFSAKDHGADATADLAPTLRAMPHDGSHANGGGQMAIAVSLRGREGGATAELGGDISPALHTAGGGGGDKPHVLYSMMPQNSGKDFTVREVEVAQPVMASGPSHGNQGGDVVLTGWQVRRLTQRECERLQGLPDGWTLIPWRGKPAERCPDGPQYKAIGNSMPVPAMRWIGRRIKRAAEEAA